MPDHDDGEGAADDPSEAVPVPPAPVTESPSSTGLVADDDPDE
jgi:hypothetical protein